MTLRVVNLGLPKSGTTTLGRALKLAGLRVADHKIRRRQTSDTALQGAFVGELMYRGYFETGDPGAFLTGFDAVSEVSVLQKGKSLWPQTDLALIRALRLHHPQVRFLASRRDGFAMSQSMLGWSDLGISRLPQNAIPGLPQGYGDTSKERIMWIDGHYATLRHLFDGDPDFLEYDVADADAPAQISDFLQLKLPWWGIANANPDLGPNMTIKEQA